MPDTVVATNSDLDFSDIDQELLERVELYSMLEEILQKFGLSMSLFTNTNMDTQHMTYQLPDRLQKQLENGTLESTTTTMASKIQTTEDLRKRTKNVFRTRNFEKTYLLYYFDLYDVDREAGKVGPLIDSDLYYPDYATSEDDRVYDNFLTSMYWIKVAQTLTGTYDTVNAFEDVHESVLDVRALNKRVSFIKKRATEVNFGLHLYALAKAFKNAWNNGKDLIEISSPEGMVEYMEESFATMKIESEISTDVVDNFKDTARDLVGITMEAIKGVPKVALSKIPTLYHSFVVATAVSVADKAAILGLGYSRSLRLTMRQYDSWWG